VVVVVVVGVAAPVRWRRGESARGRKGKEAREEVGVGLIVEQRRNKWKAELCALVYTARPSLCGLWSSEGCFRNSRIISLSPYLQIKIYFCPLTDLSTWTGGFSHSLLFSICKLKYSLYYYVCIYIL
jgi:hypothetical protein